MNSSAARRPTSHAMPPLIRRLRGLHGWRADLVALASGALSALALPPLFVLPALPAGIPVLLCLIQGARGPAVAARRGWWFGFGLHLVGLYWITEAILIEAARFWWLVPFAVPALAAVLAVFTAVPAAVTWYAGSAERGRAWSGWRGARTF